MLRRHIILFIVIRPSDGDVKPGGPLGAFREEQGMSRAPDFTFSLPIIIPHNTIITLQKQLQLSPVHYTDTCPTRNVVCPSGAWIENRPHSTPSIRLARNLKHIIVQWVGIGTHTVWEILYISKTLMFERPKFGYVCLFPVPTHCTITRFGFHARCIDGVRYGLFSNHGPLGQTTLRVGWVSV